MDRIRAWSDAVEEVALDHPLWSYAAVWVLFILIGLLRGDVGFWAIGGAGMFVGGGLLGGPQRAYRRRKLAARQAARSVSEAGHPW